MKPSLVKSTFVPIMLGALLGLNGCGKKVDVKTSVTELEKAFPVASNAPAPAENSQANAPVAVSSDANAYVNAALTAVRANDYVSGVAALEEAQRLKGVNAAKLMTIEQAKQAMIADLVARADRGDPKAKADLAAIEKTHSQ